MNGKKQTATQQILTNLFFGYTKRPDTAIRSLFIASLFVCLFLSTCSAHSQSGFFQIRHNTNVIYSNGDKTSWTFNRSFIESQYSKSYTGFSVTGSISRHLPTGDYRWGYFGNKQAAPIVTDDPDGGRLSGRIYLREPYSSLKTTASFIQSHLTGGIELRFLDNGLTDSYFTLNLKPNKNIGLEILRGNFHPLPEYSELYFDPYANGGLIGSEGGRLSWNVPADKLAYKIYANVDDHFGVSIKRNQVTLKSKKPTYGDNPLGTYTGEMFGDWDDVSGLIEIGPSPGKHHRLAYREIRADLDSLTFHDGGLKFAHFGIFKARVHYWSYHFSSIRWEFATHVGEASGSAFGTFQAWPFLEGLYRFLGERRHFILSGKINWVQASYRSYLGKVQGIRIIGKIDFVRVKPKFSYATWRPVFIGLGKDDNREGELDITRVSLMRLQINPNYNWHRIDINLLVSQWIPIQTSKRSDEDAPPPQTGGTDSGNKGPTVWGGFTASISVSTKF